MSNLLVVIGVIVWSLFVVAVAVLVVRVIVVVLCAVWRQIALEIRTRRGPR